jgi:hypothetical protein
MKMEDKPLKLICEEDILDYDIIYEQQNVNSPKRLKIKGPYIVCETKNLNGRSYKKDVMEKAVEEYITEFVSSNRALGELNHPPTTEVDPERACHLTVDLKLDGKVWVGTSNVLLGTPKGDLLAGLLNNGVKVGMSSRGVGNINESKEVDVYKLIAIDTVWNPSGKTPEGTQCFINGIVESKNFMINQHGEIIEYAFNMLEKKLENLPRHSDEKQKIIIEALKQFIVSI